MTEESRGALPPSPDSEPPLTDHEQREGEAYVYGKRAAQRGDPLTNPFFAKADQGYAYRSGYMDGKAQKP